MAHHRFLGARERRAAGPVRFCHMSGRTNPKSAKVTFCNQPCTTNGRPSIQADAGTVPHHTQLRWKFLAIAAECRAHKLVSTPTKVQNDPCGNPAGMDRPYTSAIQMCARIKARHMPLGESHCGSVTACLHHRCDRKMSTGKKCPLCSQQDSCACCTSSTHATVGTFCHHIEEAQ